jgi:hypothetical protein
LRRDRQIIQQNADQILQIRHLSGKLEK